MLLIVMGGVVVVVVVVILAGQILWPLTLTKLVCLCFELQQHSPPWCDGFVQISRSYLSKVEVLVRVSVLLSKVEVLVGFTSAFRLLSNLEMPVAERRNL